MKQSLFLYITNPDESHAEQLSRLLLSKKLIACGNMFPISSIYNWKGNVEEGKEFALIAKSCLKLQEKLYEEIKHFHTYETPCIVSYAVSVNDEYAKWVEEECKKEG